MATKIIGPNVGADYATPALWFASLASSLSANETGQCQNAEITVTAAQSLSGITTNGFTITLTAGAGNSFADHASKTTNQLRYNASNGAAIRKTSGSDALFDIQNSNVTISKLQLAKDSVYGYVVYMPDSGYSGRVIDQCILQFNNTPANQTLLGANITVKNTLVLARSNVPGVFNAGGASSYQNVVIANVSGGGGTTGFDTYSGSPTLRNVAVYGFATGYSGTAGTCANNATDKASFGGTNFGTSGQVSLVGSTEWESVTASSEDFRLKSTSAKLKDLGTATSVPSTDIIGQSRSGSTDIGVWELQSAAGLTLLKIINETDQSSEALQRLRAMLRQTAETDQNAEAKQSPRVQVRPVAESVSISEAIQAVRAVIRLVAETESISSLELITRAIILLHDETVQIAETAINVRGLAQVIAETQQASEAAARLLTLLRQTAESESVSEAKQTIRALARVLAEAVSISETSIAARVMARILAETGATAENVQITRAFAQVVAESMAPSEGSVIALGRVREIAEALQIAEALVILLAKVMQRDETSQVSETRITLRTIVRLIAETEADSEALIRLATYVRQANESSATAETTIAARVMLRLIAETEQISETSIRSFVITAAIGALLMTARCLAWLGMTGAADPTLTTETKVKPTTE